MKSSDQKIVSIDGWDLRISSFMGTKCYIHKCPGCLTGNLFIFKLRTYWYYCNNCMNAGYLCNLKNKDQVGRARAGKRWDLFRKLRHLFDDQEIPEKVYRRAGLSIFANDPVRRLMHGRLYGYVNNYGKFRKVFGGAYHSLYITPDFKMHKSLKNKPCLVLPLEKYPGLIRGYSVIMDTCKFSMCDQHEKGNNLYTYLQVSDNGKIYVFDDILEDFPEICNILFMDRECTVAVKPVTNYNLP